MHSASLFVLLQQACLLFWYLCWLDLLGDYVPLSYQKLNPLYLGVSYETKYAFPKAFLSLCWHNIKTVFYHL